MLDDVLNTKDMYAKMRIQALTHVQTQKQAHAFKDIIRLHLAAVYVKKGIRTSPAQDSCVGKGLSKGKGAFGYNIE